MAEEKARRVAATLKLGGEVGWWMCRGDGGGGGGGGGGGEGGETVLLNMCFLFIIS